jgi:predicted nucleic acid-binding protein
VIRYFDASALVKVYVDEVGRDQVLPLRKGAPVAVSTLGWIEVESAVRRRQRSGDIATSAAETVIAATASDRDACILVELGEEVDRRARGLLATHPLRAADAVHLASCLWLAERTGEAVEFVAFDERLLDAARAEGIAAHGGVRRMRR